MEINYWIISDLLSLSLLVICLYIIKDAIGNIEARIRDKSSPAILYLRAENLIKGVKILMIAIIMWSIKEALNLADMIFDYTTEWFKLSIAGFGILTAIFLSYGLYMLAVTFRTKPKTPKNG